MTVGHVRHARTCINLEVVDGKNSVADIENALLWDQVQRDIHVLICP